MGQFEGYLSYEIEFIIELIANGLINVKIEKKKKTLALLIFDECIVIFNINYFHDVRKSNREKNRDQTQSEL